MTAARCWPGCRRSLTPLWGLPVLFHLLWCGALVTDMSVLFGDGTWVSGREPT
jgi:hypothetical protein